MAGRLTSAQFCILLKEVFVRCSIFSTLLFGKNSAWEAVTSPLDDGWSRDFGGAKAIPLFRRRTAKLIKSICPLRHSSPHRKFMIWFTADDAEIDFEERLSTEPASSLLLQDCKCLFNWVPLEVVLFFRILCDPELS